MRLLTWNVNGLRAAIAPGKYPTLEALLNSLQADVICLQETKLRRSELERELAIVEGWDSFFSFTRVHKTGYSGVATFCRRSVTVPVHAEEGFTGVLAMSKEQRRAQPEPGPLSTWHGYTWEDLEKLDSEGRCLITDHGAFVLFNVYGPAISIAETAEERMEYKLQFYKALERRMSALLQAGRRVVLVGDLNLAPELIDSAYKKSPQEQQEFLTRADRVWLRRLLSHIEGGPFTDIFRAFHPARPNAYTCWSTASGARVNNYGARIDHILAAEGVCPTSCMEGASDAAAGTAAAAVAGARASTTHAVLANSDVAGAQSAQPQHHQQEEGEQQQHQHQQQAGNQQESDSASFVSWFVSADILHTYEGSDHAPVYADLQAPAGALSTGCDPPPLATRYAFTGRQCSIKQWVTAGAAVAVLRSQSCSLQYSDDEPQQQQQQQLHAAASLDPGFQEAAQLGNRGAEPGASQPNSGSSASARASNATVKRPPANNGVRNSSSAAFKKQRVSQQAQSTLLSFMQRKARPPPGDSAACPGNCCSDRAGNDLQPSAAHGLHHAQQQPDPQQLPCNQQQQQPVLHKQWQSQQQPWQLPQPQLAEHHTAEVAQQASQQHTQPSGQPQMLQAFAGCPEAATTPAVPGQEREGQQAYQQQEPAPSGAHLLQAANSHAVQAWARIQAVMQPPKCRHGEPCRIQTVKKRNENFGRQFFCCARPEGLPPEGRCDYWKWANDRRPAGSTSNSTSSGAKGGSLQVAGKCSSA